MARLWIIDPSTGSAENEGAAEIAELWSGETRLTLPALAGDGPRSVDGYDCDAVVVMGSACSVEDTLPWLTELADWVRPIVEGEVDKPLFGICFGHQLIAHLAGAPVGFNQQDRAKRLAVETTEIRGARLFAPGPHRVVVSHREQVTAAPDGYATIAMRPGVPFDGLEHRERPIASFQFHPEARLEFAERTGLPTESIDAELRADSRRILSAFFAATAP